MAALVQTIPAQTTVNMLPRPASSERYNAGNGSSNSFRPTHRSTGSAGYGYRGSAGPAPAYAFTSTPQLNTSHQTQISQNRSSPGSVVPQLPQLNLGPSNLSPRPTSLASPGTLSMASPPSSASHDEATGPLSPPTAVLNTSKPSPDRYRRLSRRLDSLEGSSNTQAPAAGPQMYSHPGQSSSSPSLNTFQAPRPTLSTAALQSRKPSTDDMQLGKQTPEPASRYRRRSLGNLDVAGLDHGSDGQDAVSPHTNILMPGRNHQAEMPKADNQQRPASSHRHNTSSESAGSARSGKSSRPGSASAAGPATGGNQVPASRMDARALNVPGRPVEQSRRVPSPLSNPSPLSRPVDVSGAEISDAARPQAFHPRSPNISSPAAEHLAALNSKENKKPKSKLRRAFSFGSAAELRKVTAQTNHERSNAREKRNSKYEDELEPEQAAIAQKQEAAGLGENIYSGQGNFYTGSTDNLSISSTASSASIMLRKMGQGVKKGTRSFVGLFRPKSVLGVPAADGPIIEPSTAQLSMVTVEAERQKVNVNVDPHDQVGGGTGFPKLERNSIDNRTLESTAASQSSSSRRSILGSDKERAEILAAVKKGILKRTDSNQSSPSVRPNDVRSGDHNVPHVSDSPRSSAPSTPADDHPRSGHRRTDSITIENSDHDDYFSSVARYTSLDAKNNGALMPNLSHRNISFSPRIQFHDTWPSGEYDRRGEIATCNRLTPMLAQQIKEELNTFKMEMEVHESSKVYTHFF